MEFWIWYLLCCLTFTFCMADILITRDPHAEEAQSPYLGAGMQRSDILHCGAVVCFSCQLPELKARLCIVLQSARPIWTTERNEKFIKGWCIKWLHCFSLQGWDHWVCFALSWIKYKALIVFCCITLRRTEASLCIRTLQLIQIKCSFSVCAWEHRLLMLWTVQISSIIPVWQQKPWSLRLL